MIYSKEAGEITPLYIYENYREYRVSNTLLEDTINKYGMLIMNSYTFISEIWL